MGSESVGKRIILTLRFIVIYLYCFFTRDIPRLISMKRKSVAEQVIVITGAAMGIGKGLARKFALEERAIVCILDINEMEGQRTVAEILSDGGRAHFFQCNVTDPNSLRSCAHRIRNDCKIGDVDIVICNAAVLRVGEILEMSDEDFKITMNVNVLGYIYTIRAFLPSMLEKDKGQIVAVASVCSHFGENLGSAYCTAKFAVRGLMDSLQMELDEKGKRGIAVTTVFPYFTTTTLISDQLTEPFSTLLDVVPLEKCVNEIVDGVLKERVSCFIPRSLAILSLIRRVAMTKSIVPYARQFMNVRYVRKSPEEPTLLEAEECHSLCVHT